MSQKQGIKSTLMDKVIAFKLFLITLYLFIAINYFYDAHFPTNTQTLYHYDLLPFMVANICFGIIISAAIYNLALYVYVKHQEYLYYALAQLSTFFFLMNLDSLHISPFDTLFNLKSLMLFDFSQLLMLFFSILFLQSFFKRYQIEKLRPMINIIVVLILFDSFFLLFFSHMLIFKFIPIFIPILFILSEIYRTIEKKDTPFYLIILGWSFVLMTVSLQYIGVLDYFKIAFPFFHIAIAVESIALSLAIAYKFKLLEEEHHNQQALLLQQSRLANMGEMVSSIAHQWRQPLNIFSFGLMNIKRQSKENQKVIDIIQKLNNQLQYMSSTIEDFRNFYNPSKIKHHFSVHEALMNSQTIARSFLEDEEITLDINVKEDFNLFGNKNELEQVFLTLISNAKDAFKIREIQEKRFIYISINSQNINIKDNAGGIDKKNLKHIFKPYFSTKKNSDGIGLHIAKLIIEKEFNGNLSVESHKDETKFTLNF
ncbi:MAG: PUTATIVE TWO-COMPONENT SENSOR [uncultured Sulfurovum sp.]|uniref:histidine kinase n=1 Tax=uncultured Sulfurovum sp. TaxID=269237 RepID=A0A6S6TH03_9BACT|nr:MAG: PUTATIVE TWO-COMPONENT SENSOR [uncultured Sulfurovum sp.]